GQVKQSGPSCEILKCVVPKSKIGAMQLPNIMYDYFLNHELGLGDEEIRKFVAKQGFAESDESDAAVSNTDQQIRKYCEATFGDSYILIEQCIKGEKRAKANIERMSVSERVINHCVEVFGNGSYILIEQCIKGEQGAKSRLGY
ncbi:MAG: hypothetical protein ABFD06_09345, partial [Smithella sp.]